MCLRCSLTISFVQEEPPHESDGLGAAPHAAQHLQSGTSPCHQTKLPGSGLNGHLHSRLRTWHGQFNAAWPILSISAVFFLHAHTVKEKSNGASL